MKVPKLFNVVRQQPSKTVSHLRWHLSICTEYKHLKPIWTKCRSPFQVFKVFLIPVKYLLAQIFSSKEYLQLAYKNRSYGYKHGPILVYIPSIQYCEVSVLFLYSWTFTADTSANQQFLYSWMQIMNKSDTTDDYSNQHSISKMKSPKITLINLFGDNLHDWNGKHVWKGKQWRKATSLSAKKTVHLNVNKS